MSSIRCCNVNFLLNNAKIIQNNTRILNRNYFQNSTSTPFDTDSQIRYYNVSPNNLIRTDTEKHLESRIENWKNCYLRGAIKYMKIPKLNVFLNSQNYFQSVYECFYTKNFLQDCHSNVPENTNSVHEFLNRLKFLQTVEGYFNIQKYINNSVHAFSNRVQFSQSVQGYLSAPMPTPLFCGCFPSVLLAPSPTLASSVRHISITNGLHGGFSKGLKLSHGLHGKYKTNTRFFPSVGVRYYSDTSLPSHYEALELKHVATQEEIKAAYLELSKQHHPDTTGGDDTRFKQVAEAYKVLSDIEKRKTYDVKFPPELDPSQFNMGRNLKDRLPPQKPQPKKVPVSQREKIGPYEMEPYEADNYRELRKNLNYSREFKGDWREEKLSSFSDSYMEDLASKCPPAIVWLLINLALLYIVISMAIEKKDRIKENCGKAKFWLTQKAAPAVAWSQRFRRCVTHHLAKKETPGTTTP